MKITHLRIYKPDGEILEFELGEYTEEGAAIIGSIEIRIEPWGAEPRIIYEIQRDQRFAVETTFVGFPYSYRSQ